MAREFIDGFEDGSYKLWTFSGSSWPTIISASAQGFPVGNYCLRLDMNGRATRQLTARSSYYTACKYKWTDLTNKYIFFMNGATVLGVFGCGANYYPAFWIGDNSDDSHLVAASGVPIVAGTVVLVEMFYNPRADGSGRLIVKINGLIVIDFTGICSVSTSNITALTLGSANGGYIDDVVVDSSEWVGNTYIQGIVPSAAGSSTQFTPSAGSNWDCVNELPPSDTDYVSTNTVDQVDLYTATDMVDGTPAINAIRAVQVQARGILIGATPAATKLAAVLRSGGVNYVGADVALPNTTPIAISQLWVLNPNTNNPFTKTEVNGLEIGIKSRA